MYSSFRNNEKIIIFYFKEFRTFFAFIRKNVGLNLIEY